MAQEPKKHSVWLTLVPTDIRREYGTPLGAPKRAHDFFIEKMTKTGPTSVANKSGRAMVKVTISVDPDIFNQDLIEALLTVEDHNLVPVFEVKSYAEEPTSDELEAGDQRDEHLLGDRERSNDE